MIKQYFTFQETHDFTKRLLKLMNDDDYAEFQISLTANPLSGNLIPGGGGLRKVRWRGKGRGKRGGVRIIYYFVSTNDLILRLDIHSKNERMDLSKKELDALVKI